MSAASDEPRRPTIAPRLPGHATAGGARSSRRPRATRASDSRLRRRTMRLLLVAVALDYADRGMLGGVAPSVRADFHVSNTQLGLAAAIFSLVGGIATLPAGVLTDRVRRTRLLGVSVMAWSVAMAASGGALSFPMLVAARSLLGVVTATAGPTVASLVGDLFPPRERGARLGAIDSGELVGSGVGLMVATTVAAVVSWRGGFWVLALAGAMIARWLWRLPEPPRTGGQERSRGRAGAGWWRSLGRELRSLRRAVGYVLGVRTLLVVVAAASLGDFFFAGVTLFAVEFLVKWYGLGSGQAALVVPLLGAGALGGVNAGGRLADRLVARGHLNGRLWVACAGYLATTLLALPAFLVRSLAVALPLFTLAAAALALASPALDAVRLDVIRPQFWGRSEGLRTLVRIASQAAAPLAFGLLADHLSAAHAVGLQRAFLVTLPLIALGAGVLLLALRSYARDARAGSAGGT